MRSQVANPAIVTIANSFEVGDPVTLSTTGALPTGLVAGTTYYVTNPTPTGINLATTYANAVAGTTINTTGTQSGVQSISGLLNVIRDVEISELSIRGGATYTATNFIYLNALNSRIHDLDITGATTLHQNCINITAGIDGTAWVNVIENNSINTCSTGIMFGGSDTHITTNYIYNANVGMNIDNEGAVQVVGNEIGNSVQSAIIMSPSSTCSIYGQIVGNNFNQGLNSIRLNLGRGCSAMGGNITVSGNLFENNTGTDIVAGSTVNNAIVTGNIFTSALASISFAGSNSGWIVGPNSYGNTFSARFIGLPADTLLVDPDSSMLHFTQIISSQTLLGLDNVNARFGAAINAAGLDAALLTGSINGDVPYVACASGETTTAIDCQFYFNTTEVWHTDGINFYGLLPFSAEAGFRMGAAGGTLLQSVTAPTLPVACTSPSVFSANGTAAFNVNVGTSCSGITTLSFTMPAATNFWACSASDITTPGQMWQTAQSSTGATFTRYNLAGTATDFTASDTISIQCTGH